MREEKTIKKKKIPWNYGKRKPIEEDGKKWCNCLVPKLTSNHGIGGGTAYCLKCGNNYYH